MATYYVDSTSGADGNDGLSSGAAWQTLAKVNTAMGDATISPGDTILFKRGETFSITGAAAGMSVGLANITLDAYGTGNAPILTGDTTITYSRSVTVTAGGSGSHFTNLKFTTSRETGVWVSGANCEVDNCEFVAIGSGVYVWAASCLLHDNNFHDLSRAEADHGAVGVWLREGSDGSRVYSNTFDTCYINDVYGVDGGAVEFINEIDDVQVYNNYAVDCDGFAEFGADPSTSWTQSNIILYNNLVINCNDKMAWINTPGTTYGVTFSGVEFHHMTIVGTAGRPFNFTGATIPTGTDLVIKNCIIQGMTDFSNQGENFTHEYNLYSVSSGAPAALGTGEFVGYAGLDVDYTLKVSSGARGTGIASAYTTDYNGYWRSDPPDLGAHEYQEGRRTTLTLQPAETAGNDTTIRKDTATFNYGISSYAMINATGAAQARGLIKFDLSSIPSNATISSATLTLYCSSEQTTADVTAKIHRSLVAYFEGAKDGAAPDGGQDGSTWNLRNANGSVAWVGGAGGAAGSDYATDVTVSVSITAPSAFYDFNVLADVQAFVAGTATNLGWWVVHGNESASWKTFSSSTAGAANRPKLVVEYTVPSGSSMFVKIGGRVRLI